MILDIIHGVRSILYLRFEINSDMVGSELLELLIIFKSVLGRLIN